MTKIYLDESGDLGFNFEKGSSKYFVVCFYQTDICEKILQKQIKIAKQRTIKKSKNRSQEVKGSSSKFRTKELLFRRIRLVDPSFRVCGIVVNKEKVYVGLRDNPNKLYNWICKKLMEFCNEENFELIIDKKDKKVSLIHDINMYLEREFPKMIQVNHQSSDQNPGLQIVDIFSNTIFKFYEREETELYKLMDDRLEVVLYFDN